MVRIGRRYGMLGMLIAGLQPGAEVPAMTLGQAIRNGQPDVYMRYRFEHVDDAQQPQVKDAYANTLRTAVGYGTGLFHGFGAYFQLEDIRALGNETFNDGGANHVTSRALVVDPEGTEVQQANLRYRGVPRTLITAGRQEIEHRQAPLHRYVGNILWRQNWQTFDALRITNDSLPATHIDYAYLWNVNRIFGEDNRLLDRSDYRSDSHVLNVGYGGLGWGKLEGYSYLLDFGSPAPGTQVLSTATLGARLSGQRDIIAYSGKLLYTVEYARQVDYANNPTDLGVDYYLFEFGGLKLVNHRGFESVTVKASYEVLGGDGPASIGNTRVGRAFQTPLGTNHAFQGWADRFLTTPADGIEDWFGTLAAKALGAQLVIMYHDFSADRDDYDYGHEWDVQLTRTFAERYLFGLKYAQYSADGNPLNVARNGGASAGKQAFDLDRFWAWVEFRF